MKIHLIAIGGSVMHNLALTLHAQGMQITGSDDEIYEPSRTRLFEAGILPVKMGWNEENIVADLDAVILGMHAKKDNPELAKAQELNIPIYSFPAYIYEHAKKKKRIVVAGSHGKTTTTSMILHILKKTGMSFDYLVGAQLEGFNRMVQLSEAPLIVLEGDEYLSSAIDPRPKMLHYKADLAIITGIAWDHINVFPSYDLYVDAFKGFLESLAVDAKLFYDGTDQELINLINSNKRIDLSFIPYYPFQAIDQEQLTFEGENYDFQLFGDHNRSNAKAAFHICLELGLTKTKILSALSSFKGAAKRLQKRLSIHNKPVFIDFAHAPSKVKASIKAIRAKFPDQKIAAILELHTYSSLNVDFLPHYSKCLNSMDSSLVFIHNKTLEIKNRPLISASEIIAAFDKPSLTVLFEKDALEKHVEEVFKKYDVLLIMSSGQLGGIELSKWIIAE